MLHFETGDDARYGGLGTSVMGEDEAIAAAREALNLIVSMTMPSLLLTAALGLIVTVFQAVTKINDSTLQQELKIYLTVAILFVTAPALYQSLRFYFDTVIDRINTLATP